MNDKPSHEGSSATRKFCPEVKLLENRVLLSQSQHVDFPDGSSFNFFLFQNLPRTGGVSMQSGSVLGIGVGQPKTNSAQVTDDGVGDDTVEWNGRPTQSFTGIKSTVIQIERAKTNTVTFHLVAPRTSPDAVAAGSNVPTDAVLASEAGHRQQLVRLRTNGAAVQSGSLLTVTVDKTKSNIVEISNEGGGAVAVEWNGGSAHSYTGVSTIVVDTKNAPKDLIALDDTTS